MFMLTLLRNQYRGAEGPGVAQTAHGFRQDSKQTVDIVLHGLLAEAETEARSGALAAQPHRHQDAGWLGFSRVAGGTTRHGDALLVQSEHQSVAAHTVEVDI